MLILSLNQVIYTLIFRPINNNINMTAVTDMDVAVSSNAPDGSVSHYIVPCETFTHGKAAQCDFR